MRKETAKMEELSIVDMLKIIRKKLWFVAAITLLCTVVAFVYTIAMVEPTYAATSTLLVGSGQEEISKNTNGEVIAADAGSITAAEKLVNSYIEILKSDVAMEKVKEHINTELTTSQIKAMLSLATKEGTQILKITATSPNPDAAIQIANAVRDTSPEILEETLEVGIAKPLDTAKDAGKVGPSITMNALMGFLIGLLFSVLIVLIRSMLDRTVKNEEDIKEHYDVVVLGSIPDFSEKSRGGDY